MKSGEILPKSVPHVSNFVLVYQMPEQDRSLQVSIPLSIFLHEQAHQAGEPHYVFTLLINRF